MEGKGDDDGLVLRREEVRVLRGRRERVKEKGIDKRRERQRVCWCVREREGHNIQEREDMTHASFEEYSLLCWFICLCYGMVSSSSCSH